MDIMDSCVSIKLNDSIFFVCIEEGVFLFPM